MKLSRAALRFTVSFLGAAPLTGCGTLEATHSLTGPPIGPAPVTGEVRVVMQGQEANGDYEELAIVQAVGRGAKAEMPLVLTRLKDEARAVGGNGVINVRIDQGTHAVSANGVAVRFH